MVWVLIASGSLWAADDPLTYERVSLPAERNAYTLWEKALPELKLPHEESLRAAVRQMGNAETNLPPESAAAVRAWVDSKATPLALVSEGIARGVTQLPPWPKDDPIGCPTAVSQYIDAAHVKAARGRLLAEDGNYDAAVNEFVETVTMGRLIAEGGASLIEYQVGRAVQAIGYVGMQRLVSRYDVPPTVLDGLQHSLGASAAFDSALAQTYRAEYQCQTVPILRQLRRDLAQRPMPPSVDVDDILSVERTVETIEPFLVRLIANTRVPWVARDRSIVADAWKQLRQTDDEAIDGAFGLAMDNAKWEQVGRIVAEHPNALGDSLIAMVLPALDAALKTSVKTQAHHELTWTLVALQRSRFRTHALPDTLGSLSADGLLDGSPLDPFSGKPFRYDRAKGLLWSVGPDEADDGGDPVKDIAVRLPAR